MSLASSGCSWSGGITCPSPIAAQWSPSPSGMGRKGAYPPIRAWGGGPTRQRRGGGGESDIPSCAAFGYYILNHGIDFFHHHRRGNSQRPYALFRQPPIAPFVALGIAPHIMRRAIHFDRQPGRSAVEIEHIRADRMLVPKFEASGSGPEHHPEAHLVPSSPGARRGRVPRWFSAAASSPPPMLRNGPPPHLRWGGKKHILRVRGEVVVTPPRATSPCGSSPATPAAPDGGRSGRRYPPPRSPAYPAPRIRRSPPCPDRGSPPPSIP